MTLDSGEVLNNAQTACEVCQETDMGMYGSHVLIITAFLIHIIGIFIVGRFVYTDARYREIIQNARETKRDNKMPDVKITDLKKKRYDDIKFGLKIDIGAIILVIGIGLYLAYADNNHMAGIPLLFILPIGLSIMNFWINIQRLNELDIY